MPCDDVSELLELSIDDRDRIVGFSLHKQTCGAPVGDAVLMRLLAGRQVQELLQLELDDLRGAAGSGLDRFLLDKQLRALKAALAVYLGQRAGGLGEPFVVARLEHDEHGTRLSGQLTVGVEPAAVEPCGSCCSSRRTPPS